MDRVVRFFRHSRALVLAGALISCASAGAGAPRRHGSSIAFQPTRSFSMDVVGIFERISSTNAVNFVPGVLKLCHAV